MKIAQETSLNLITDGNMVAGVAVSLSGLELKLLIAGHPYSIQGFNSQHVFRPKFINFFQAGEVVSIGIAWMHGSDMTVWLSRGDPGASLPQDP